MQSVGVNNGRTSGASTLKGQCFSDCLCLPVANGLPSTRHLEPRQWVHGRWTCLMMLLVSAHSARGRSTLLVYVVGTVPSLSIMQT
jgi:hypothetical protein